MTKKQNNESFERCLKLIKKGDVMGVLRHLEDLPTPADLADTVANARYAWAAAVRKGMPHAIDQIFKLMLGICGDLLILSQLPLKRHVDQISDSVGSHSDNYSRTLLGSELPHLTKLHHHAMDLAKCYASTMHVMDLKRSDAKQAAKSNQTFMRLADQTQQLAEEQQQSSAHA